MSNSNGFSIDSTTSNKNISLNGSNVDFFDDLSLARCYSRIQRMLTYFIKVLRYQCKVDLLLNWFGLNQSSKSVGIFNVSKAT